ncbi:substrate-binding domain-containing protein [Alphaproteobacteria bacterium]|nr:substrate-binding domain-containing protein [Alphaproteobacteria bacterium]MDC3172844.1 substrate-binding domain-containing protein [Alphaproteobacteria bacterium]|tara:strand:+ start:94 stop:1131 length:1038 start_codon:yes stop_codon:yes gene_type:complete
MKKTIIMAGIISGLVVSSVAQARDTLSLAGSSTVLPFARIIAEQLGKNPNFKTPVVESGGSSVGKKGVCDGVGTKFIDIGNASSRMKTKELAYCEKNGVKLTEIKVGYDGIVVANSKKGIPLNISKADLGKALTAEIPVNGKWVKNPYKKWSDINPALPDIAIRVYGPPTTSGTRASYAEMVNQKGYCAKDKEAKAASVARGDKKGKKCRAMRTDGVFIEAGEQDNLIVQKLNEDTSAYGIFGFSYLDQNSDTLQGAVISKTAPTFENIAGNNYSVSRALYYYVKHQHIGVVPGMKEYMAEWTKHWGDEGALSDAGMIPMPKSERAKYKAAMTNLPVLTAADLKK